MPMISITHGTIIRSIRSTQSATLSNWDSVMDVPYLNSES
jgi:hypothetical protein